MKLQQLRYLEAVATELNFTAAAARCNVSQPPLSRAIRELEDEVGAKLVERDTHRVALTPAGECLVRSSSRAITMLEEAAEQARRIASGQRGTLKVGFGGSTVYSLMPKLIRAARGHLPDISIAFVAMPVLDQIEALREGVIDLGILRLPVHDELIETRFLHTEPLIVALPQDHAASGGGATLDLRALATSRFVTYQPRRGFDYHSDLLALCHRAGFVPGVMHEAATTEAVIGIVACGEGIAVVPASAQRLHMDGVVFRSLAVADDAAPPTVSFAMAWHRGRPSELTEEFVRVATLGHSARP